MIYVALIGLTLIIVRGTVFRPIRRIWPALLECSQCTGMWVGMAAGAMGFPHQEGHGRVPSAIIVGAATSFLSLLADALLLRLLGEPEGTEKP